MAHAVESHPQKKHIIDCLLAGMPLRKLAATLDPPIYFTSLQRYKLGIVRPAVRNAHVLAKVLGNGKSLSDDEIAGVALETATKAVQAQHVADPYLARTAKHRETIDQALAVEGVDGRTVAALIGTDLKGMELDARLTGRLDSGNSGTTNIYMLTAPAIVFGTPSAPEPVGPVVDVTPEK